VAMIEATSGSIMPASSLRSTRRVGSPSRGVRPTPDPSRAWSLSS
jgi:hypothetical protein